MNLAIVYLLAITAAEVITVLVDTFAGIIVFAFVLLSCLVIPALNRNALTSRLVLALALVPLVRIVSLAMPVADLPQIWWYPVMYAPLLLAALIVDQMLGLSLRQSGFNFNYLGISLLVAASGTLLGLVEYLILRPAPLVEDLSWQTALLPSFILLVTTGLVEEFIFRGVLQKTAVDLLGRWGIVYVSVIFAVMHIGFLSVLDIVFVMGAGLYFGYVVHKTGSILGVTLAHGATNIMLFIVCPLLFG